MYTGRVCAVCERVDWGYKISKLIIRVDLSETTKSHRFNMSLKLTNDKLLMVK